MFTNGRVLWKSLIILGQSKILILYNLDSRIDCLQRLIIISCYCDRQCDFFCQNSVPVCVLFCHSHRSYRYLAHSISREQLSRALIFCLMNFVRENKSRA